MQVSVAAAHKMFKELNIDSSKWTNERLLQKLQKLPTMVPEDFEFETTASNKLSNAIQEELKTDKPELTLVEDAPTAEGESAAPAKKGGKKAAPKEEAGADDEAPAAKKAPKKAAGEKKAGKAPPKKAGGEKGPGVIGTIIKVLEKASAKKPVTKADIVEELAKAFPDREKDSMLKTVNVQVPTRLKVDKKITVQSTDLKEGGKGYWIEK